MVDIVHTYIVFIVKKGVDTSIRGFQYFLHLAQLLTIVRNRTFNLNLRITLKAVFSAFYIKFTSFFKRLSGIVREEARYILTFSPVSEKEKERMFVHFICQELF